MPLAAGDKLGPYELLALIGEGGMGAVYRARDPRLNRDVAVKVSAERFSERFEREARAIAALNHPNICTLFDVGPNYLVMELVEGESPRGPMPLDEALAIAQQISDALDAAHDKGIVHRDLKPANIKIKPDGTVKVLDFGLAKMGGTPAAPSENSPTISMAATQAGVILGTAAYMSPEQARGKVADKRADIWAFGVVLHELLTGKRLFQGEDLTETLASVVKEQPNLATAPIEVRRLLKACLEKDPKKRLQSAGDWKLLVEEDAPAVAAPSKPRLNWLPWVVATAFAIGAGILAVVHFRESPPPVRQTLRYHIPGPERGRIGSLQISPDGHYLAIVSQSGSVPRISIQSLDELERRDLAGTEGATYPFWAPDSAHLGFFAEGKLKKIALAGGPPTTLCDAPDGRGGTWTDNDGGVILISPGPTRPIMRVSSSGGDPKPVAPLTAAGTAEGHRFPSFLPDGVHFFYSAGSDDPNVRGLWVGSLKGDAPVRLLPDITQGLYAPPAEAGAMGNLLFLREQVTLMAQPFDMARLKLAGEAVPLVENIAQGGNAGFGAFAVGGAGLLIYREGNANGKPQLVWMDRGGKRQSEVIKPAAIVGTSLSPDEKTLALNVQGAGARSDIWLQQVGSDTPERVTSLPGLILSQVFEPSGARLAFSVRPPGQSSMDIYVKPIGGGQEGLLLHGGVNVYVRDWSPDGKFIVYQENFAGTAEDLFLLPIDGDHKPVPYLRTPSAEINARFSPDGRWMAYQSNEGGTQQVWVQDMPATGKKFQISTMNGTNPMWRRDGKELYYADGPDWMAVPITLGANVQRGTPQRLFPRANINMVAASRDGQRFLVAVPEGATPAVSPITVVTNWQAGLKK